MQTGAFAVFVWASLVARPVQATAEEHNVLQVASMVNQVEFGEAINLFALAGLLPLFTPPSGSAPEFTLLVWILERAVNVRSACKRHTECNRRFMHIPNVFQRGFYSVCLSLVSRIR